MRGSKVANTVPVGIFGVVNSLLRHYTSSGCAGRITRSSLCQRRRLLRWLHPQQHRLGTGDAHAAIRPQRVSRGIAWRGDALWHSRWRAAFRSPHRPSRAPHLDDRRSLCFRRHRHCANFRHRRLAVHRTYAFCSVWRSAPTIRSRRRLSRSSCRRSAAAPRSARWRRLVSGRGRRLQSPDTLLLKTGRESWKWILASPAIFAVIGLLLRASAPESPMWLAARDAGELQRVSFGRSSTPPFAASWLYLGDVAAAGRAALCDLHLRADRLGRVGLGQSVASPAGSIAITVAFALGAFGAMPLVEGWGRRPVCIVGFPWACCVRHLAVCANRDRRRRILAYAIGMGAATVLELVYPAELFPTLDPRFGSRIRSRGQPGGRIRRNVPVADRHGAFRRDGGHPRRVCALGDGLWISLLWAPETKGTAIV